MFFSGSVRQLAAGEEGGDFGMGGGVEGEDVEGAGAEGLVVGGIGWRGSIEGFVLAGDGGPGVAAACDFEHIVSFGYQTSLETGKVA